jgi:hypothetical protein
MATNSFSIGRRNSISRVDEIESVRAKVAFQFVDPVLSVSEDLDNNHWLVARGRKKACILEQNRPEPSKHHVLTNFGGKSI